MEEAVGASTGGDRGTTPAASPHGTPGITPSSSGGGGSREGSGRSGQAPISPDVYAAIDVARLVMGGLANDVDQSSSEEEDEVLQRYPGRERHSPRRHGQDGSPLAANAVVKGEAAHATKPVLVRDLSPPLKSVKKAMQRDDWPLWETALEVENSSMIERRVCRKQ